MCPGKGERELHISSEMARYQAIQGVGFEKEMCMYCKGIGESLKECLSLVSKRIFVQGMIALVNN
jgi:hypothetical protein